MAHFIILRITSFIFFYFLFFKDFVYLWERERERERQREKQAPCREPDVGLDPGTPGSHPGLKVALNHWATQGSPSPVLYSEYHNSSSKHCKAISETGNCDSPAFNPLWEPMSGWPHDPVINLNSKIWMTMYSKMLPLIKPLPLWKRG